MTDIVNIPLNKLTQFEGNVRKTQNKGFIDELAASIKAHGLQQNLVVKKEGKQFAVVAGSQRLTALLLLAKAGEIKGTHPVPCKLAEGDIDPSEISLLENVLRDDMHPADEFEAFRDLIDKGVPVADIAARFGVSETVVTQRLKLARVSPAVLKAYREERLTLEKVMAFAVSDDHAAQEKVLENLRSHGPQSIREALTENEIAASDRRVKFVTLKAYEKAGGTTRRDLFSEGEDSVFILDAALLDRLVTEKLERAAKSLAKEGWKWTVVQPAFDYDEKAKLRRVHAEPAPLPPKLAREAEALEKELETLQENWHAAEDEIDEPARIGEIEDRLDAIEDKRGEDVWTPAQVAMAGAVLTIGHDGKAQIERGLVRPEEWAARNGSSGPSEKAKPAKPGSTGEGETPEPQAPGLSAALIESLTAQRSAALAAELQQRPDVALAAIVHAFASRLLRHGLADGSSLEVAASSQSLRRVEGSKAHQQIEAAREKWSRALPEEGDLWAWCLEQKQGVLLELLAFCAASTINAVRVKTDRAESKRFRHSDKLAAAVGLDMKAWFTPDAPNYFSRVSKPQILDAIREAKGQPPAPAWEKLKKAELAQEAERQLAGSGWMPELLRPAA
jgi:ParB family chromosome partitioning protein